MSPEIIASLVGAVFLAGVIVSGIWVAVDISRNHPHMNQALWVLGTLLLWIVFFPLYLIVRSQPPPTVSQANPAPVYVSTPAGWYREGHGWRWWDGQRWTDYRA